jgi:hypothetical protein
MSDDRKDGGGRTWKGRGPSADNADESDRNKGKSAIFERLDNGEPGPIPCSLLICCLSLPARFGFYLFFFDFVGWRGYPRPPAFTRLAGLSCDQILHNEIISGGSSCAP